MILILILILFYLIFQCCAVSIFAGIARDAYKEVYSNNPDAHASDSIVKRAIATIVLLVASVSTSVLYFVAIVWARLRLDGWVSAASTLEWVWVFEFSTGLDIL